MTIRQQVMISAIILIAFASLVPLGCLLQLMQLRQIDAVYGYR